jgi:hypothetical protein
MPLNVKAGDTILFGTARQTRGRRGDRQGRRGDRDRDLSGSPNNICMGRCRVAEWGVARTEPS